MVDTNLVNVNRNPVNDISNPQTKLNEIKVNETKVNRTKEKTAATGEQFRNCFEEKAENLKALYPHADYEAERETCIAEYQGQAVKADPYLIILKWFNRIPKPGQKAQPKTFEQIKMDNTKKVMVDFIKKGETDAAIGQEAVHSDIRGAFRSVSRGPDDRTDRDLLEISAG
jgi:hypothetical protein